MISINDVESNKTNEESMRHEFKQGTDYFERDSVLNSGCQTDCNSTE